MKEYISSPFLVSVWQVRMRSYLYVHVNWLFPIFTKIINSHISGTEQYKQQQNNSLQQYIAPFTILFFVSSLFYKIHHLFSVVNFSTVLLMTEDTTSSSFHSHGKLRTDSIIVTAKKNDCFYTFSMFSV